MRKVRVNRYPVACILEQLPRPIRMDRTNTTSVHVRDPADYQFTWHEAIHVLRAQCVAFWHLAKLSLVVQSGLDAGAMNGLRGLVTYPHPFHAPPRLAFVTRDEADRQIANEEGIELVGGEELVAKIQESAVTFDKLLCSSDMLPSLNSIARMLGPQGLMPSVRTGTVVSGNTEMVRDLLKRARNTVPFRMERGSTSVVMDAGPLQFSNEQLEENVRSCVKQIYTAWQALPRPAGKTIRVVSEVQVGVSGIEHVICKVTKAFPVR